ncbi:Uncharacterised protein [Aeromonas caviae]|nr:Uncharacterised protein [Aeromonas caviae]
MVTVHIKGHVDCFGSAILFRLIRPTWIIEFIQVTLTPCRREYPLNLIDQEECPLGCPVVEPRQMIAALLGFCLDIKHLEAVRYILTQHLSTALNREAAHVGNDVPTRLDGRDHIGVNSAA